MPSRPGEAPEVGVTLLGRFAVTVDGVPVAEASWRRRHAAAIVKVLALTLGHRLHREQVIDLVWPGDTIAAAVPKLHKAAHFARRAIGVPDAVLLRGGRWYSARGRTSPWTPCGSRSWPAGHWLARMPRRCAVETLYELVRSKNIRVPSGRGAVPVWPPRDS